MKVFLAGRIAVEPEGVVIDERHFLGRQGRLLFAYLVVEHGRPVPRDKLADVLWGDAPPATWDKALSVLVSKLRGVLGESGLDGASALTAAFGCYQLDLPEGTWVDVLAAESAASEAEGFLEADELESATVAAALAESVTRSPFLPGDDGPWVEEKRRELAEVRARALSTLAEACLGTDKPAEAVRWAGRAVEAEPFRESGYRRLMKAHVAAGNRGEALQVYERCRRVLADELGAYPSPETESIYRSLLEPPSGRAAPESPDARSPATVAPPAGRRNRPALTAAALVLVVLVAAGTAIAVVATRGNGSKTSSGVQALRRVALVVPSSPAWARDPSTAYVDALNAARTTEGVRTQTFHIDLGKPGLSGLSESARQTIGKSGLVLLAGQFVGARFAREFARHPQTRFIVLDPDPVRGALYRAVTDNPNAQDVFFIEGSGAYMAGFLSALMAKKGSLEKRPVISMIGISKALDENVRLGFRTGAKKAVPDVKVLVTYSHDFLHPARCAAIAHDQIESGSRVVYADAGGCSPGALTAVQEQRGVWGVEGDQAPSTTNVGSQIIGYTVKDFGQVVQYAIQNYVNKTLSPCHHVDIGIEVGAVDFQAITNMVPQPFLGRLQKVRHDRMPFWRGLANDVCAGG